MLAKWNQQLETEGRLSDATARDLDARWVWRVDPMARFQADIMLNESQLTGLLLARHAAAVLCDSAAAGAAPRLTLMDTEVSAMRLSQLHHTVSNLTIEWAEYVERGHPIAPVRSLLDQCFARFGALCLAPGTEDTLDDPLWTQPAAEGGSQLTFKAMRWFLSAFVVLRRHIALLETSVFPPPDAPIAAPVFHRPQLEASMDEFYLHQMHLRLPAGAKTQYMHDFPEMYSHVSQVAFFHKPDYERSARASLEDINARRAAPVDVLSLANQLFPAVPVRFEEDLLPHPPGEDGDEWYWLLVAGRIYLVPPDGPPLHDTDLLRMLEAYLASPEAGQTSGTAPI